VGREGIEPSDIPKEDWFTASLGTLPRSARETKKAAVGDPAAA